MLCKPTNTETYFATRGGARCYWHLLNPTHCPFLRVQFYDMTFLQPVACFYLDRHKDSLTFENSFYEMHERKPCYETELSVSKQNQVMADEVCNFKGAACRLMTETDFLLCSLIG
jgi:hypothetical protein